MRKVLTVAMILCLTLPALAEGVVRPQPRPAAAPPVAVLTPGLRPLRRPGATGAASLAATVEAALPPPPEPAPVVLPSADEARATLDAARAPRDRLDDSAPVPPTEPTEVVLSASNAPRLPESAAAFSAQFVAAAAPPVGPRTRPGPSQVTLAAAVLPPLRPARRPDSTAAPDAAPPHAVPVLSARPRARPAPLADAAPEAALVAQVIAATALPASLRPAKRPKGIAKRRAAAPAPEVLVAAAAVRIEPGASLVRPKKGSVCGDPSIRGEKLAPIPAKIRGCGIAEPVRVTEVDGVRLSVPATLDCDAARALTKWVERGLKPAADGARVTGLTIAASYSCRPRNNVKGAKISEHGRGNAIDIAAVTLADGRTLDVLRDYKGSKGAILRRAHKAACGIFGTTLGPGSDGYHENHLHFDVAAYRSGPYCR